MRIGFDRTTLIFLVFLLIIGALFGVNYLVTSQPPLQITVAVDPLAEDWLRVAASAYNDSNPVINGTTRINVQITVINDLNVWRNSPGWTASEHPTAWVPSSRASLDFTNLPFVVLADSLARTPLLWGGFEERVTLLTENTQRPFEWAAVQEAAEAQRWEALGAQNVQGNVNMALVWPDSSMAGVGVLLSAAANYGITPTIDRSLVGDGSFEAWFAPLAESLQNLGENPAQTMAARGTAAADFALLPESLWLGQLDNLAQDGFTLNYPAYQFVLDFPLARWAGSTVSDNEIAAVESFRDFLLSAEGQSLALEQGLRPAQGEPGEDAALFVQGVDYGIQLEPDYGLAVEAASPDVINALIRLVER